MSEDSLTSFLYNKTYVILIFSESMSHVRFTAILKYLSFLDQEQTDSQQFAVPDEAFRALRHNFSRAPIFSTKTNVA